VTDPRDLIRKAQESFKPTGLDSLINRLAPTWGLKRLEARATMAIVGGKAWTGARRDLPEMKNWNPVTTSPDEEQRWDRPYLVSRSTDLERNDALAGGAVAESVLGVVGTGLSLHPEPNRKILGWSQDQAVEWAEERKARFNLWASDPRECDIARRRNFFQGQSIAYRTVASRGDGFVLLPRKRHPGATWFTKFQIIEGDRVVTPADLPESISLSQGVEVDEAGGFKGFWFAKHQPIVTLARPRMADCIYVPAWGADGSRLVLPLMHETRLDLRRGYPLLAPVIATLKQLSRLSEAELAAAVVTSFFAVVIKKNGPGAGPLGGTIQRDDTGQGFTELGHAIVAELAPGEEITPVAPTRPNGAFDPYWNSMVTQLAMRIQIPPEVLLKKFSSSYTAAKGALLMYFKWVLVERENLLAPDFCQPIYETWLAEDVASGGTKAPGFFVSPLLRAAYGNARWVGDNPPILDENKAVKAAMDMISAGLSTRAEQTMRLTGGDFEANYERLTREQRLMDEAGLIAKPAAAPFAPPSSAPGPKADPNADPNSDPNADPEADPSADPTEDPAQDPSGGKP
jgi:lambda family phage portal protein